MGKIICGIQQVGIGVPDKEKAWQWYRQKFGMDIPIFEDAAEAPHMSAYTGDEVQSRTATLAFNIQGGGGFEIWQFTSRNPDPPEFEVQLGDTGIFASRIKTRSIVESFDRYKEQGVTMVNGIVQGPAGHSHFFIKDLHGFIFQVVEGNSWFTSDKHHTGGQAGCLIGVSDVEQSLEFYRDLLEYDQIIYDEEGIFNDLSGLPGGNQPVRRVLLAHSEPRKGSFSRLIGPSRIELIQALDRKPNKIFRNRYWGDLGFIHLCFDIKGMEHLEKECKERGFPFTVNSADSFDMGDAAGHFSYIEDPDGTLIEFVETHRIPIWKKVGWFMDVKKQNPEKPIPNWMLHFLKLSRVRS